MRRILPLLLLLAVAASAGSIGGPVAPAAAKSCAKGKLKYKKRCVRKCPTGTRKAKGRRVCVKRKPQAQTPPTGTTPPAGATPPAASAGGAYSGETDQSRAMSFTVANGQVIDFVAGVNTYCNTSGNQRFQFDAIGNVPPIPIQPDGSFHYEGTSDEGNPVIDGRVTGATATGTVGMSRGDSSYNASTGYLEFGSCSASDRAWSATAG